MSNITPKEVSILRKNFNLGLIGIGIAGLRNCFKVKATQYPRDSLKALLQTQGYDKVGQLSFSDLKYYVANWQDWQKIIKYEWVNKREYYSDRFDCDNFAFYFAANVAYMFNLNSAGVAYGSIYNKDTGKYINRHAFNMIVAIYEGKLQLIAYEPKKDYSTLVLKGQKIIMGNWEYRPDWLFYF
ncbi:MAG: hypothetical protein JSV32_02010 [Dehalococcoidia bacterium]|nr:MAG: hypothetical protein JSV32_02010 [Dehalococcoidia bacterium]